MISEKALKLLILEDINNFLAELGEGFCYIRDEYKIKIGNRYNYIDILLFNYKYNSFVVLEFKITELKKEHINIYLNGLKPLTPKDKARARNYISSFNNAFLRYIVEK